MFLWFKQFLRSSVGVIVFLGCFLILLEIQSPRFFSWDDNATFFSGCYHYNYESVVHQKSFPWMVWTQYSGQTNLSQSQCGLFYIPAYIATAFATEFINNPLWNIEILVIGHLLMGACGMICLLRHWKIPFETANAAGLLYASTPFLIIVSKSWIFVSYSMAFMPWLFLSMDRILEKPTAKEIAHYVLLKAVFFTQGYTQVWINLSFIEGLFFLGTITLRSINLKLPPWRMIRTYSGTQLLHLFVIFPLLLINIQTVADSAYRVKQLDLDSLIVFRVDLLEAFLAQLCYFRAESYIHSSSVILFFGGTFALLFYLYHKLRNHESFSQNHLLMLSFLLFCFLLSTSLYGYLTLIPPFNILRWPIKFMIITPFFFTSALAFLSYSKNDGEFHHQSLLLFASAILQMTVLLLPVHQKAFSNLRIENQKELQINWPYESGRALPICSSGDLMKEPRLLGYNYGNWTNIPTLAGYDPLISKINSKIALKIQITGSLEPKHMENSFPHLKTWGVRYLTGSPLDPEIYLLDSFPQLRRIHSDSKLIVWEYTEALPLISSEENPQQSIEFKLTPKSILFYPKDDDKNITVRFAPLKQLFYRTQNLDQYSDWNLIQKNSDDTINIPLDRKSELVEVSYRPENKIIFSLILSSLMICILIYWVRR